MHRILENSLGGQAPDMGNVELPNTGSIGRGKAYGSSMRGFWLRASGMLAESGSPIGIRKGRILEILLVERCRILEGLRAEGFAGAGAKAWLLPVRGAGSRPKGLGSTRVPFHTHDHDPALANPPHQVTVNTCPSGGPALPPKISA
jgi:hypothetical protein